MKSNRAVARLILGVAAIGAMAACADGPSAPFEPNPTSAAKAQPSKSLLGGLLSVVTGLLQLNVTKRTTALPQNITVSAVVTPRSGGTLSIPAAGLTVNIPPGAVSSTMTITVTALKGNLVAYDFGPSGTKFNVPLHVTQSTSHTDISILTALLGRLHAAYFKNDSQLNYGSGTGVVTELLPATLSALFGTVQFDISHFSGYMIGTTFDDGSSDGSYNDGTIVP